MLAQDGQQGIVKLQVTIAEAATLLSFTSRTVRRLLQRGELDFVGHGRGRRIPMESLKAYIENNRQNYDTTNQG